MAGARAVKPLRPPNIGALVDVRPRLAQLTAFAAFCRASGTTTSRRTVKRGCDRSGIWQHATKKQLGKSNARARTEERLTMNPIGRRRYGSNDNGNYVYGHGDDDD